MQSQHLPPVFSFRRSAVPGALLALSTGLAPLWAAPQVWDFNSGTPAGLTLFGSSVVADSGSYDNSGYLSVTDAVASKSGGLRIPSVPGNLDQIHVKFKARVADGTQGDGFSLTISPDLPAATSAGETGYKPTAANPPRFIVAFDTYNNGGTDFVGISVIVNGKVIADIPTGVDAIPPLYSDFGDWTDVDINLKRSGKLTLAFGGVTLLNNVQTGFEGIDNALIGLDARTGTNFETHWFDDLSVDFTEGDTGALAIGAESELGNLTSAENAAVRFAVVPTGEGPFAYQWSKNGTPIDGATHRALHLAGTLTDAGSYSVTVSNAVSQVTSTPAVLTITPDLTAPQLVSTKGVGGTVNSITLTFSEPLDPATASAVSTWSAGSLTILSATLSADGRTVVLLTSPQANGQNYIVGISGLKDRSAAGNPLAAASAATFTGKAFYDSEVLADGPVRYWQFEETTGLATVSAATGLNTDPAVTTATYQGGEFAGDIPTLLASQTGGKAVNLSSDLSQWVLVPNGTDINSGGPYARKTIELWIKPTSLPSPDLTGLDNAGLWEEGGADRGLNLYLWKNPDSPDPDTVSLVFHAYNRLADGPGSPFGLTTKPAVYAEYPGIRAGQTYHIAAVLDGDNTGTNGNLILYVNGLEVKRAPAAGQLYGHGSDIRIGGGNGRIHTGTSAVLGTFNGVIDEVSHYNKALSGERVAVHYFTGNGVTSTGPVTIDAGSDLGTKTVSENSPVEFSVNPSGNGPFTYQWYFNGTALDGQTSRILSLSGAAAQAGSYTVKVSNTTHSVISTAAVLKVTPDLAPASVAAISGLAGSLNQVWVSFSEPVDPVTAGNPATYAATGLTVLSATLSADGQTATLQTSPQQQGKDYPLTITGLKDRSAAGNPLTSTVSFHSEWSYGYEVLVDSPVRFWRFGEGIGTTAASIASGLDTDPASIAATLSSGEFLESPSLLPSDPGGFSAGLDASQGQYLKVPNGSDLNATKGPWAKKTVELWFKANSLPAPDATDLSAAYGLWEQGQYTRDLAVYLWRNPEDQDPNTVSLIFNAFNDAAADGPGSPFGVKSNPAVYVEYKGIRAATTYHVAAVFDGDATGTTGNLILYVNGVEIGRAPGVGQLYNHTGDVRIGQGNGLFHSLASGDILSFDGSIDEVAHYNKALTADRIAAHYQTGITPAGNPGTPVIQSVQAVGGSFVITWTGGGILQWASNPAGTWTDIPTASSPYTDPIYSNTSRFYRLIVR